MGGTAGKGNAGRGEGGAAGHSGSPVVLGIIVPKGEEVKERDWVIRRFGEGVTVGGVVFGGQVRDLFSLRRNGIEVCHRPLSLWYTRAALLAIGCSV